MLPITSFSGIRFDMSVPAFAVRFASSGAAKLLLQGR
jgi:hypothetical protein